MKKYLFKGSFIALTIALMIGVATSYKTPKVNANADLLAENENLVVDKTAKDNGDGSYSISLNSYITGSVKTETVSKPLDVVLIMDQSSSMLEAYSAMESMTVNEALKNAASSFIQNVKKDSLDNGNTKHRIGLVEFSNPNSAYVIGLDNSLGSWSSDSSFTGAMVDITNDTAYNKLFSEGINSLNPGTNSSTYPSYGFNFANKLFKMNPSTDDNREKVVIFFTDGIPSVTALDAKESDPNADDNKTLALAKQLKKDGAKVYSVAATSKRFNQEVGGYNYHKFLNFVSSNYPDAGSMGFIPGGTFAPNGNYFSANNSAVLDNIFESILDDVLVPSINLDETTVLRDFMSEYFVSPNAADIKVYKEEYIDDDASGNRVFGNRVDITNDPDIKINVTGKRIDVTGFDYTANVVTKKDDGTRFGSRLVVEFNTQKENGFIGGKDVPTNTKDAGIYVEDAPIKNFPLPKVDVKLDYDFESHDNSLYIGSIPNNMSVMFDSDLASPGIQYKDALGGVYTINGVNNAFVDTTFTISDKDGKVLATYVVPAGSTQITGKSEEELKKIFENSDVTVNASIKLKGDNATGLTMDKQAKINAFTPKIEVSDNVLFYGEKVNLSDQVKMVGWECANKTAAVPNGSAPVLNYEFKANSEAIVDANSYEPNKTQGYKVDVLNNGLDITNYTVISNVVEHLDYDFEIQVVKGELVIEKKIDDQYSPLNEINAEQSFTFKIDYTDENGKVKTYYHTIQFSANEGVTNKAITLKGLRKGTYTVSELSNWSWRYDELTNKRLDNYNGNGTVAQESENQSIVIGDRDAISAETKMFYGSESGTMIAGDDHSFVARTYFENKRNNINVVGDVASAINLFTTGIPVN